MPVTGRYWLDSTETEPNCFFSRKRTRLSCLVNVITLSRVNELDKTRRRRETFDSKGAGHSLYIFIALRLESCHLVRMLPPSSFRGFPLTSTPHNSNTLATPRVLLYHLITMTTVMWPWPPIRVSSCLLRGTNPARTTISREITTHGTPWAKTTGAGSSFIRLASDLIFRYRQSRAYTWF